MDMRCDSHRMRIKDYWSGGLGWFIVVLGYEVRLGDLLGAEKGTLIRYQKIPNLTS